MDFLVSSEFGRLFFFCGTLVVLTVLWLGYYKNIFYARVTMLALIVFVTYISLFLWSRYSGGDIANDIHSEGTEFILLAIFHGTISLLAIVEACYIFLSARHSFSQDINYFQEHKKATILLAVLWPLALVSGLFM